MSQANKDIAVKFLNALGGGDAATVGALITEDVEAITPGTGAICGTRNHAVMMAIAEAFPKIMKDNGITFKVLNLTAEGDRVACEAEGYSTMLNGKSYNNTYHFLIFIRDGRIYKIKEYLDVKLADEVLGPYLAAGAS
jgi:uncharacterized protein